MMLASGMEKGIVQDTNAALPPEIRLLAKTMNGLGVVSFVA